MLREVRAAIRRRVGDPQATIGVEQRHALVVGDFLQRLFREADEHALIAQLAA